jgi:hypothetical protein
VNCRVCGTPDHQKPQIFKNEAWCCDNHRKVIDGEREPTHDEWTTMDKKLLKQLARVWS